MKTTEQHLERLWLTVQEKCGGGDRADRQAFNDVVGPLVRCLNKIAGGGMFSETACVVEARKVLGYSDQPAGES